MIILDTNVISALMRETPDPVVLAWLDAEPSVSIWTTTITVLEIRFGLATMAAGRRRDALTLTFSKVLDEDLERRVLTFDLQAAEETAKLMAQRQVAGPMGDLRDSMIAGIAIAHKAVVATRNVRHFADAPVTTVNPWSA